MSDLRNVVIYHKADHDGILCREIAKRFLPEDTELIGWDYGDPPIQFPAEACVYVLDLAPEEPFGKSLSIEEKQRVIWIDHHATSLAKYENVTFKGYRINGVAACRLAWQWFSPRSTDLPKREEYEQRRVAEPTVVKLLGEYDIWDHRGDGDLELHYGVDSMPEVNWQGLLASEYYVISLIERGSSVMQWCKNTNAEILKQRSFLIDWEGIKFLALNTSMRGSGLFDALDKPETGHGALMAFYLQKTTWNFSLYHAAHDKTIDLSKIAVRYGGGGHPGACGFRLQTFDPPLQVSLIERLIHD